MIPDFLPLLLFVHLRDKEKTNLYINMFHICKKDEHNIICSHQKVPCINHSYGCPLEMTRNKRASHLNVCPASVQRCILVALEGVFDSPREYPHQM
jgi:predicted PP-loop superfamily ATPase